MWWEIKWSPEVQTEEGGATCEDWRGAESEANVDVGPTEVEDCAGLGPAGSEVMVRVQGGNNRSGDD